MNRRKPERVDQRRHRHIRAGLLALGAVTATCVACSSGSSNAPTSSPLTVTLSGSASSSTSTTTASRPATITPTTTTPTTTTPAPPAAHCPTLKAAATAQPPLACTSATVIGAAAARVGLKRDGDESTIVPGVSVLFYFRTTLLPLASRREVDVYHYANGSVPSMLCSGVVAKALDPTLGVCTDVGPSTRTDRPAVRAWALRAEAAVARSAKVQPTLTSGSLTFVACASPSFPKSAAADTTAFQMNIYVQHSGGAHASGDCAR